VATPDPAVIRSIAAIFVAFNLVHAALAWRYFFVTPIITDVLIAGCLVLVYLRAAA
jgi:hypothetical protein